MCVCIAHNAIATYSWLSSARKVLNAPQTRLSTVSCGSIGSAGVASRGSDGGGGGAAAASSAAACARIAGISLSTLPWRLSHAFICFLASSRSFCFAAESIHSRKKSAKRCAGVFFLAMAAYDKCDRVRVWTICVAPFLEGFSGIVRRAYLAIWTIELGRRTTGGWARFHSEWICSAVLR